MTTTAAQAAPQRRPVTRTPAVEVRPITQADVPEAAAIERAVFGAEDAWTAQQFRAQVAHPDRRGHVAVTRGGGDVLGYVFSRQETAGGEPVGHVLNLAVSPEARGAGVGSRLLSRALEAEQAQGAQVHFLEVEEHNTLAQALFAGQGFELVARLGGFYATMANPPSGSTVGLLMARAPEGVALAPRAEALLAASEQRAAEFRALAP